MVAKAWVTPELGQKGVQLRYFAGPEPLTPDRVRWASKASAFPANESWCH